MQFLRKERYCCCNTKSDMSRPKKDAKYLNVYIERDIHEQFDEFCRKFGQSKTVATERALKMYMKEMVKYFDTTADDDSSKSDIK